MTDDNARLIIVTPIFDRRDGIKPVIPTSDLWEKLPYLSTDELIRIGLGNWGQFNLWLFPMEWYNYIPEGMEVTTINEDVVRFEKGQTDDDTRFGFLAYGIIRKGSTGTC